MKEIQENSINVFRPVIDEDDEEQTKICLDILVTTKCIASICIWIHSFQAHMPFAIVSSLSTFEVGGRTIRGRKYPWGIVDGECCDRLTACNLTDVQSTTRATATSPACALCSSGTPPIDVNPCAHPCRAAPRCRISRRSPRNIFMRPSASKWSVATHIGGIA